MHASHAGSCDKMEHVDSWMKHGLGPCACSSLRRTARTLSSLYDEALAPSGLTVTQYAVLVNLARQADGVSRTELATLLGMERTTLTRNLGPLERQKLVAAKTGDDRRASIIRVTPAGRRKIEKAFPAWAGVQSRFVREFGMRRFAELQELMAHVSEASARMRPDPRLK